MRHKVLNKQTVSHNCFICGESNIAGLKMPFYEIDTNEVVGYFKGSEIHCSYSDRMHGGIISAILDETIGRAIMITNPELLGVTMELTVRFIKPVPINTQLQCVGRITKNTSRVFVGTGEILNDDGQVLASASASYFKVNPTKMGDKNEAVDELFVSQSSENKEVIEIKRQQ